MKITGKFGADIVGIHIKRNKSHDGREAFVDIEIDVRQEDAEEKFGPNFALLAFGTMHDVRTGEDEEEGTDKIAFLQDSITPGRRVVFEKHKIEIDGEQIVAQPGLLKIQTVDGEARVVNKIRIPVDAQKKALISKLMENVGGVVKVSFSPQQASFDFQQAAGTKSNETVEQAAAAN